MTMAFKTRILMTEFVTHSVKRFVLRKPKGFRFIPGQGALVAINRPGWKDQPHPFTPTSLNKDLVLEFTIKGYPGRRGLTARLHKLAPGDELLIGQVFGDIRYKGPGVFIAAGAGITPFIAILRRLRRDGKLAGNRLIFSNRKWDDIIYERELRDCLGDRCIFTLTREKRPGYESRRVDKAFLRETIRDFKQHFYVCGPPGFITDVRQSLEELGAQPEKIILDEP